MSTRDLVLVAVFAALTGALGIMPPVPLGFTPIPVTLQTFGIMLAGLLLGPVRAASVCLVVLALVAAGLPLLAGGRGGLGVFAGPTAGFLLAWAPGALVVGWLTPLHSRVASAPSAVVWSRAFLAAVVGGIVTVYAGGIAWLGTAGGLGMARAAVTSLAFVPGDLVKAALAASAAVAVERALPGRLGRSAL